MSHNSGSVGQGPLSPSKDEVSPASAMSESSWGGEEVVALCSANMEDCVSQRCDLFAQVIFSLTFNKVLSARKKWVKMFCLAFDLRSERITFVLRRVTVFLHWSSRLFWEKGWSTAPLLSKCLQDQAAAPQVRLVRWMQQKMYTLHLLVKDWNLIKAVKTCSWKNSVTESCMAEKTRPNCFKAA